MKWLLPFSFCLLHFTVTAQTVPQKLQKAFQQFERDSQLKHAISSLYVIDAKTGQVVFDKNSQVGLAPASTQKIITSVTAFELLGKEYRYKTELIISDSLIKVLNNIDTQFFFVGYGDPTFGSWRFTNTSKEYINHVFLEALRNLGIKNFEGYINVYNEKYKSGSIPGGWIWEDIGNYYGAAPREFNWGENQYDLILRSGKNTGDSVEVVKTIPENINFNILSELRSAPKNSGDNAYIYYLLDGERGVVRGTIPLGEDSFKISGALSNPGNAFLNSFIDDGIKNKTFGEVMKYRGGVTSLLNNYHRLLRAKAKLIYTHYSPSLDSIIYWFLKKSINLYGEALVKTFAYEKQGFGSTDSGVAIVKKFWNNKGFDEDELNIYDGSGLSPLNRVTTHAQVEILKYAKTKEWFPYFYKSLPDYNGMTLKSGTISDVKGFCGYHKAKNGKEYIFSFLVNNYSGKTSGVVNKMYKVLDELK
ncbi:MAG: D-alanyl-D-alanine carboxypeptidase/D-alanyl-D-alanine-endopeptidase [Chitinophagaceae bacterium]